MRKRTILLSTLVISVVYASTARSELLDSCNLVTKESIAKTKVGYQAIEFSRQKAKKGHWCIVNLHNGSKVKLYAYRYKNTKRAIRYIKKINKNYGLPYRTRKEGEAKVHIYEGMVIARVKAFVFFVTSEHERREHRRRRFRKKLEYRFIKIMLGSKYARELTS